MKDSRFCSAYAGPIRLYANDLFDPPPPEEALVGGILFDVGRVALLKGVHIRMHFRLFVCCLGIIARPFVTSIGRRDRRHMTVFGHRDSPN